MYKSTQIRFFFAGSIMGSGPPRHANRGETKKGRLLEDPDRVRDDPLRNVDG